MSEKRPRRRGLATALLVVLSVAMIGVFVMCAGVVLVAVSVPAGPRVASGTYLELDLAGAIPDAPSAGALVLDPVDLPPVATEIAESIREAAVDERIEGVYLRLRSPSMGWALRREIRTALAELREAGKPCVAYSEMYSMGDYYLASACDKVVIARAGVFLVNGISSSVTYYRDALEKLGVESEFVYVGDYKTAVEPFMRMGPSEAAVESYEALYDSLYASIVSEIAASRGWSVEEATALFDQPRLEPSMALERKLVDGLAYEDQVIAALAYVSDPSWSERLAVVGEAEGDDSEVSLTPLGVYRADARRKAAGVADRIAVIHAEGPILPGSGDTGLFATGGLYDGPFAKWMSRARTDDRVKAVVIRVNSPGGAALAADRMWHEIERVKAAGKPVVVSMGDYAASGGYMISCNADWIVAQPTTLTGSIGVFGQFFNVAKTYEMLGLAEHTYKRGEHSAMLGMTDAMSESERAILQSWINETYAEFVQQVADGRRTSVDKIEPVAQGRVWTGSQALKNGLVDELGGLEVALAKASSLAQLTEYRVVRYPKPMTFFDVLLEDLSANQVAAPVTVQVELPLPHAEAMLEHIEIMRRIHEVGGVAVYNPVVEGLQHPTGPRTER